MTGNSDVAEACGTKRDEIIAALRDADERWRSVELRFEAAEDESLKGHFDSLRGGLGLQSADLDSWREGGLREKVRGRVERLLLAPLAEAMRRHVKLGGDSVASARGTSPGGHVLDDLFDRWEGQVEPVLSAAGVEDAKLERRTRRRANLPGGGGQREVWRAEEQERPALWTSAQQALDELHAPTQRLRTFWESEVQPSALDRLVSAVPAIVVRAVCDWRFQRCSRELDQLDGWWQCARRALQKHEVLWDLLIQEEGLFVRRVERGIEALRDAEQRYGNLAGFGCTPAVLGNSSALVASCNGAWLADQSALLADAVKEMRERLRPIRDAAAWRVVDAAKMLQRRIRSGEIAAPREPTPWEQAGRREGARKLAEALASTTDAEAGKSDPSDPLSAVMGIMKRLDKFIQIVGDLKEFAQEQASEDLVASLGTLLQGATIANEDLLELLDEPSVAGLDEWRAQWDQLGKSLDAQKLESSAASLSLKADATLGAEARRARRLNLLFLRGVQFLAEDAAFRKQLVAPAAQAAGVEAPVAVVVDAAAAQPDGAAVDLPPEPVALTPRGSDDEGPQYVAPRRSRLLEPPTPTAVADPTADEQADIPAAPAPEETAAPEVTEPATTNVVAEIAEQAATSAVAAVSAEQPVAQSPTSARRGTSKAGSEAASPAMKKRHSSTSALHSSGAGVETSPVLKKKSSKSALHSPESSPQRKQSVTVQQEQPEFFSPAAFGSPGASRPSTSESWTRPTTPAWLLPPWPRPDTPSMGSWTRPDTPSTACEEEQPVMPRFKFVEGQRVTMRPAATAGARLPPLRR